MGLSIARASRQLTGEPESTASRSGITGPASRKLLVRRPVDIALGVRPAESWADYDGGRAATSHAAEVEARQGDRGGRRRGCPHRGAEDHAAGAARCRGPARAP